MVPFNELDSRLVEDVVLHLPGRVAAGARGVPDFDLELAQAGLAVVAARVVLTVQRGVVLEHEDRQWSRSARFGCTFTDDRARPLATVG